MTSTPDISSCSREINHPLLLVELSEMHEIIEREEDKKGYRW